WQWAADPRRTASLRAKKHGRDWPHPNWIPAWPHAEFVLHHTWPPWAAESGMIDGDAHSGSGGGDGDDFGRLRTSGPICTAHQQTRTGSRGYHEPGRGSVRR